MNTDGLKLDKQRHLQPIWGMSDDVREGDLIAFLEEESGLAPGEVTGWDLMVHSVEPPAYLGRDRELVAGPRMDNLLSVHAATAALASVATSPHEVPCIPVLAAFDHEENGSQSDTGADGPLLGSVLERSVFARGGSYEDRARAFAGTVCLSSDTGHAVHPNYAERHDPTHHPRVNGGPILKVNVNNRYATDGSGRAVWAAACDKAGVPFQNFVSNNSMPCGTTIGPITAARHGIKTVDIGVAILSMHSARELCGADDPHLLANALVAFLEGSRAYLPRGRAPGTDRTIRNYRTGQGGDSHESRRMHHPHRSGSHPHLRDRLGDGGGQPRPGRRHPDDRRGDRRPGVPQRRPAQAGPAAELDDGDRRGPPVLNRPRTRERALS